MIFQSLLNQLVFNARMNCIASIASVSSLRNYMPKAQSGQLGKEALDPGRVRARLPGTTCGARRVALWVSV